MVRCEKYYEKCEELINLNVEDFIAFCMKDPETQRRIFYFVTKVRPLIQMLVDKSEILSEEKPLIGGIISEGASQVLVSEDDQKVIEEVSEKIVKRAEEKVMERGKPRVTGKEVKEIYEEIKREKSAKSKTRDTGKTSRGARPSEINKRVREESHGKV